MKKALFIWFKQCDGILEGGGQANMRNYMMAQRILGRENVDSVYIHDISRPRTLWEMIRTALLFPFGYFNGLTPKAVRTIVQRANGYDFVFINTTVFGMIAKQLKESGYRGITIAHFHNVESKYYDSLLPKYMLFRQIIIRCAYRNDGFCCQFADRIVALNERDSTMLGQMYGRNADVIAPIALPDQCDELDFDTHQLTGLRPLCLFIGSNFTANAEGVLWFVRNVLPHTNITFKVVGKGMAKLKEQNDILKDIEVISDAPSLQSYFLDADFLILPIFSGSGMKVKTCEAMMYGRNILGTDETFEGYDVDYSRIGGRCNTAEDFISKLQSYINNPVPRFNDYSRTLYLTKYSPQATESVFERIFTV